MLWALSLLQFVQFIQRPSFKNSSNKSSVLKIPNLI